MWGSSRPLGWGERSSFKDLQCLPKVHAAIQVFLRCSFIQLSILFFPTGGRKGSRPPALAAGDLCHLGGATAPFLPHSVTHGTPGTLLDSTPSSGLHHLPMDP